MTGKGRVWIECRCPFTPHLSGCSRTLSATRNRGLTKAGPHDSPTQVFPGGKKFFHNIIDGSRLARLAPGLSPKVLRQA